MKKKLQELCDIPIFHDDQHGTAIVVIAALENALKIVKKKKNEIKVVVSGAGAAGIAITKLMLKDGYKNIVLSNIDGIIYTNNPQNTEVLEEISKVTNMENEKGSLKDAINNADVFVGVSAPEIMSINMVKSMKKDAIIFALANPVPEIMPESAILGGAKIVATGRSDFPNQVNNVLAFPGIFRGALDSKAKIINDEMKLAAAKALANHINDESLSETCILPSVFDENISKIVGKAVYDAAILTDVCRK